MNEINFLETAYFLLRSLPVSDVHVSFSVDVCNTEISAKLDAPLLGKHFKLLADSQLIIMLDGKTYSLTINHPDFIPF